jgi:N-glycosylase/DNA lyase
VWRFEIDTDLSEFNKLAKRDKIFYPVFRKWMGMRNAAQFALYELLIVAIVLQNATVRRSQQMLDALLGKFGKELEFDGKKFWAIWLPEDLRNVSEEELRGLKIGYRAKFIKRLSEDFTAGKIDEYSLRGLGKEDAKRELMKLYGVGPETARILLFEAYHRYDVFDHIAPWQQKIYSRLFYGKRLVPAARIRDDINKRYGKYSMLAVHYIWEDIFWKRRSESVPWLEKEIRL